MATKSISTPPEAAIGLDLFAAAWLERWNAYGGTVHVNTTSGNVFAGSTLPEPSAKQGEFRLGKHAGATNELLDLLRLVPGGRAAVAEHVARFPSFIGQGGEVAA